MLGRHRKAGFVCACALVNVFAALYAIPLLLGSFEGRLPEMIDDRRNEISSNDENLVKLQQSTERRSKPEVHRLPVRNESSSSIQFGYLLEPLEVSGISPGLGYCEDVDSTKSRGSDYVTGRQVSLLIVVCSAVENSDRRNAIRSTWGNRDRLKTLGVRLVFVVALPQLQGIDSGRAEDYDNQNEKSPGVTSIGRYVLEEHRRHGDIVQLDIYDHYVNLTLKTLGALRWAVTRCPQTTYVAKTDDDVFINVAALFRSLNNEETRFRSAFGDSASRSFIAGHVIDSAKPVRDRRSKWYTPETMFDGEFYPPYTSGTGYAMGIDVVRRILVEADNDYSERTRRRSSGSRRLFWLEDIYVSGMMAARLDDVRLVHDERFNAVRRRAPKMMMMMMSGNRLMGGFRSKSSAELGETVDESDEVGDENTAEVCWYLRQTITVHDLTPNELQQLWNRLTTSLTSEDFVDETHATRFCDKKHKLY